MRAQNAIDGVGEVLGLQVGELALLLAQLEVEEVVVDLRDQRLERHAVLDARGLHQRRDDVARVNEAGGRGGRRNRRLLKVARRMARGGDLLDALAKDAAAAHQVQDLGLVQRHFNGAGADVVGGCADLSKLCVHSVLLVSV